MIAFLFSPLARYLGIALAIVSLVGSIYVKGRFDGAAKVQTQWDAAVKKAIDEGRAARTDADRAISNDPDGGVRDPLNRDR